MYIIRDIHTNMFRSLFWPRSGLCSCYKHTTVVNCVTITP